MIKALFGVLLVEGLLVQNRVVLDRREELAMWGFIRLNPGCSLLYALVASVVRPRIIFCFF